MHLEFTSLPIIGRIIREHRESLVLDLFIHDLVASKADNAYGQMYRYAEQHGVDVDTLIHRYRMGADPEYAALIFSLNSQPWLI